MIITLIIIIFIISLGNVRKSNKKLYCNINYQCWLNWVCETFYAFFYVEKFLAEISLKWKENICREVKNLVTSVITSGIENWLRPADIKFKIKILNNFIFFCKQILLYRALHVKTPWKCINAMPLLSAVKTQCMWKHVSLGAWRLSIHGKTDK